MCLRGGALPEAKNCSSRLPLSPETTLSPLTKAHRLFSKTGEYSGCSRPCGMYSGSCLVSGQRPLLNNNKMNSRTSAHQNHYQEPSHRKDKTSILRNTQRNLHFNCDFFFYRFFFQSCYSLANTGHNSSNRMCFPGRTLEQLPTLSFLVFCQVSTAHVPSVSSVSLVTKDPPSVWSCP